MKTIGVLGGMGWESSADWYRRANELVRDRIGGYASAPVILDSLDFAEIQALQAADDWDEAGRILARHAQGLEAAGAELIVLCTNTMHICAPAIVAAITVPFLHIADIAADAIAQEGISTVGLLGTAFTMEKPFYRERLAERGITTLVPDDADRAETHRIIFEELVQGVLSDASHETMRQLIAKLVSQGAQGIILGCTEIELLVSQDDSPVPVFPTTALHVEAALDAAQSTPAEGSGV